MGRAFGNASLAWNTGRPGLRSERPDETRYVRPSSFHAPALLIATASSLVATLFVLGLGLLRV